MTNTEIILGNMMVLIADGVITPDAQIHTYAKWKSLGYQVKKGETAIAKFPIWKYTHGKKKQAQEMTEEEAQARGYCFMKLSAFFSDAQVERITDKEDK